MATGIARPAAPRSARPGAGVRAAPARAATRIVVACIGVMIGVAGIEHGIGEIAQGNAAPEGIAILSWPDADAYRFLGGEPALTIVPNFLATGILAVALSLAFLVATVVLAPRRHGGLVLVGLSLGMLLFGGGYGPPLIGIALGIAATRIGAPLAWWRAHPPVDLRRRLGRLWPWVLGADLVAWLLLFPGTVILGALVPADRPAPVAQALAYAVILAALGLLLLAIVAGLARDSLAESA